MGKGERMPTLEEALSLLRGRALVNLDQKVDNLAPQLLHAIARAGSLEETLLSGAASRTFHAMRELAPSLPFALSIDVGVRDLPLRVLARLFSAGANGQSARLLGHARAAGTDLLALDWRLASRMVVERLSRAGVYVLTWTVDDLATMRVVRQAGVHGITSNRPDLLMHLT
jgi:glycerophosphoryl diester phosphodiesterase